MLSYILFDVEFFPNEAERANSQKRVLCLLEALVWINRLYLQQHPDTPLLYQSGVVYKAPAQFDRDGSVPELRELRAYLSQRNAPSSVWSAFETCVSMVGGERFREIPKIIENGGGDCDNLAAARVAELRELGISASPYITWRPRPDGGTTYHVIVLWPDGSSEDPSLLLGMGGESRLADRLEEERKLAERTGIFIAGIAEGVARRKLIG